MQLRGLKYFLPASKPLMIPQQGRRRSARLSALYSKDENGSLQEKEEKKQSPLKELQPKKRKLSLKQDKAEAVDVEISSPVAEKGQKRARSPRAGPTLEMEESLWAEGYSRVAGVDEAGRGPLAGPVVAAACVIPQGLDIEGIRDSKQLSESKREEIYAQLMEHPRIQCSVAVIDAKIIDKINILQATLRGMHEAVQSLTGGMPDFILIDGNQQPQYLDASICRTVVKGDTKCMSIAAASILAKVTRDRMMLEYDKVYPQYGLAVHKGYPTKAHIAALKIHGQCPIHRKSFKLKNAS